MATATTMTAEDVATAAATVAKAKASDSVMVEDVATAATVTVEEVAD